MSDRPSPNGANGAERGPAGRFAPGNRGGPGNPHGATVAKLRAAMLGAVSEADVQAIVGKLVALAREGSVPAIREVLDRTLGRPVESDLLARLDSLEAALNREGHA